LSLLSDIILRLVITAQDQLTDEQKKKVQEILALVADAYVKSRNISSAELERVGALVEHLEKAYNVVAVSVKASSLEITLQCPTLESLEQLWGDCHSGRLNEVAEMFLVTAEMKTELKCNTNILKATIDEENYLTCKKVLMEMAGKFLAQFLS